MTDAGVKGICMSDTDITRIYDALNKINESISGVKEEMASMHGHCDGCTTSLDTLKSIVFGNGGPGLKGQVTLNAQQLQSHLKESQTDCMWRRMAMLSAAIAVVGWAVTLYAALGGK